MGGVFVAPTVLPVHGSDAVVGWKARCKYILPTQAQHRHELMLEGYNGYTAPTPSARIVPQNVLDCSVIFFLDEW